MNRIFKLGTTLLMALLAATAVVGSARADDKENAKAKNAGAVTTLIGIGKVDGTISLLPQGATNPIIVTVSPMTLLGGICFECKLFQQFKASDPTLICDTCGCGNINVQCIAWKSLAPKTWQAMLTALPRGVALRVVYNIPDKAESGVKALTVDRRTVLMPIDGLSALSTEQLAALVKPIGGEKVQLVSGGKQLLIDLNADWTLAQEAKLEAAVSAQGSKLTTIAVAAAEK